MAARLQVERNVPLLCYAWDPRCLVALPGMTAEAVRCGRPEHDSPLLPAVSDTAPDAGGAPADALPSPIPPADVHSGEAQAGG
eukprot:1280341-Alexandrium_andersonii.AAC.1